MPIKINKQLQEMIDIEMLRLTPEWPDVCEHGQENYLFSFFDRRHLAEAQWYDVHVYKECGQQEFCIRYGSSVEEYLSPGGIGHLMLSSNYERLVRILKLAGNIVWIPE